MNRGNFFWNNRIKRIGPLCSVSFFVFVIQKGADTNDGNIWMLFLDMMR
ncbi:hypothetical protein BBMN23_0244 [Bifidobacterium adolescentis]|nr:hypothetical protein BBMN23_0244 [Bifidobacterium adolescentis]